MVFPCHRWYAVFYAVFARCLRTLSRMHAPASHLHSPTLSHTHFPPVLISQLCPCRVLQQALIVQGYLRVPMGILDHPCLQTVRVISPSGKSCEIMATASCTRRRGIMGCRNRLISRSRTLQRVRHFCPSLWAAVHGSRKWHPRVNRRRGVGLPCSPPLASFLHPSLTCVRRGPSGVDDSALKVESCSIGITYGCEQGGEGHMSGRHGNALEV
jgi:hypothetical protein